MSSKIAVVMVVQNDTETVIKSLQSFYPYVDAIIVSTDPEHGWSGSKLEIDDTIPKMRDYDKDKKIQIIEGDFYKYEESIKNDTYQRQYTVDVARKTISGLKWILQIDADEEFLDFPGLLATLNTLPFYAECLYWRWIPVFNTLPDGRYLIVCDEEGQPKLEVFPVAHRPDAKLRLCRYIHVSKAYSPWKLRREYDYDASLNKGQAALHYTFAKSEGRIRQKLESWSHSSDFDTKRFFDLWKNSLTNWADMKDFHPLEPKTWPRLRPFTREELYKQAKQI